MAQLVSNNQASSFVPEVASRAPQHKVSNTNSRTHSKPNFADQLADKSPAPKPSRIKQQEALPQKRTERANDVVDHQLRSNHSTNRADSNGPAKKTEKQLDQALKSTREAASQTPILSFLSGRVENISPDQIPALVGNNEFITQALSEADMQAFFDQPQTLAELTDALELPNEVLAVAQMQGITPTMEVTPRELLEALGQDPNRALIELSLLKERLPNEGVSHYMARSASLRKAKGITDTTDHIHSQKVQTAFDEKNDLEKRLESNLPANTLNTMNPNQPFVPVGHSPEEHQDFTKSSASTGFTTDSAAEITPSTAQSTFDQQALKGQNLFANTPANQLAANGQQPALLDVQQLSNEVSKQTGTIAKATHNGFDSLGQRISRDPQAVSINFMTQTPANNAGFSPVNLVNGQTNIAPGFQQDSAIIQQLVKPHLFMNSMSQMGQQMAWQPSAMTQVASPDITTMIQQVAQQVNEDAQADIMRQAEGDASMPVVSGQLVKNPILSSQLNSAHLQDAQLGLEFQDLAVSTQKHDQQTSSEEQPSEHADQDLSQQGRESLAFTSFKPEPTFTTSERLAPTNFESQLNVQDRAEIMREIAAKATAFIRNPGSSNGIFNFGIRNDSLGQIDIALSLNGDQLDIKMLTTSDQSRDRVVAELAGLKEALSTQSVHLGKVDVGVGQQPASQQPFSEQQAFQFSQDSGHSNQQQSDQSTNDLLTAMPLRQPQTGLMQDITDLRSTLRSPVNIGESGSRENLTDRASVYSSRGRLG